MSSLTIKRSFFDPLKFLHIFKGRFMHEIKLFDPLLSHAAAGMHIQTSVAIEERLGLRFGVSKIRNGSK